MSERDLKRIDVLTEALAERRTVVSTAATLALGVSERKDFLASASAMLRPLYSSILEGLLFNACQLKIDVCGDPAFFPGLRTVLIGRNSIRPGIAAGIEQQAPRLCVIIFPAIGQDTFVAIQFKSFCIGVFPATTPTVMCDL